MARTMAVSSAALAACALIALFGLAVGDKGNVKAEPFMIKQLMRTSGKAATSSERHNSDVDTTTVRFRVAQYCPAADPPTSEDVLTVLTCDKDESSYDYRSSSNFAIQPTIVGYCFAKSDDYEWTGTSAPLHHIPVPGNPTVGISGMYTMACTLNEAARECGVDVGPGGLQISSNGFVYETLAWSTFNPLSAFPSASSGCPAAEVYPIRKLGHRGSNHKAARTLKSEEASAEVAYYHHEREQLPSTLYSGALYIFSGALTVSSVDDDCPYDGQGFLEYLGPEDTDEAGEAWNTTTAAQLPPSAVGPLKHPFTITMRFRSTKRNAY